MPYAGQVAALATKHGKLRAVARPLRVATGLAVIAPEGIDTDQLGTFTGERERPGDARSTVLAKARLGMAATGLPLGLASEGSFGPHPVVPFATAGIELVALIDEVRGFSLVESVLAEATTHATLEVADGTDLAPFLARVRFPSHAVIVRPRRAPAGVAITKGIVTTAALDEALAVARAASADGVALVESDLRAHRNPMRLRSIGHAATRLARRLACRCPACGAPGFGRVRTEGGLPCGWCAAPTALVAEEVLGCVTCAHEARRPRADGRRTADPGECPVCNP